MVIAITVLVVIDLSELITRGETFFLKIQALENSLTTDYIQQLRILVTNRFFIEYGT